MSNLGNHRTPLRSQGLRPSEKRYFLHLSARSKARSLTSIPSYLPAVLTSRIDTGVSSRIVAAWLPGKNTVLPNCYAKRFRGDISLAAIAKHCGLSTSRFAHAFKESFGKPAHRWLIVDIALRVGFSDQTSFNRSFKRATGTSPYHWHSFVNGVELSVDGGLSAI